MAIWRDLVDDHGFPAQYASVRRFVITLRGQRPAEAHPVIVTAPGEEGQVDYGDGPMVRHPDTGKYRRTRLFVFTLGYSRKSVRLLTFKSSTRRWAELHEETFRRLGGAVRVVVLDNLREGVLTPDIYDPTLNPLYRDVLAHYGAVALPCRVGDPDRKGKVESAIGHTQGALKGLRFETLDEAQAYLDRWDARWADTRIHGTTKRQVAAMFAEERPALLPLPVEPFRYYQFGTRTVHLDGCVEVEYAYYAPPPGWLGRDVAVQWDGVHVRLLHPTTGALLREHRRQAPGRHAIHPADRPTRTPPTTLTLLAQAARAGAHVGTLCETIHRRDGQTGVRRILGRPHAGQEARRRRGRGRLRRGPGAPGRRLPLRPALPRAAPGGAPHPAPGRSAHPRPHPLPRRHRAENPGGDPDMNLVELQRALRQLRCSGMAAGLEPRLLEAQTAQARPHRLPLHARPGRAPPPPGPAPRAPRPAGRLPRPGQDASTPSTSTSTRR